MGGEGENDGRDGAQDKILTDGVRRYDLDVELRGSIALSQRPDGTASGTRD